MSYIALRASTAKALASDVLESIASNRKRERESTISRQKLFLNKTRRWFFLKPYTDEDVIAWYERQPVWNNTLYRIESRYWSDQEDLCNQVLIAVKYGDPVNLSLKDLETLEDFR